MYQISCIDICTRQMDDDGSTVPVMLTAGTLPKVSINRAAKARTCVRMYQ